MTNPPLHTVTGFDWDDGNRQKSNQKHAVTDCEAEEVFMHSPLLLLADLKHSSVEARYFALGHTAEDRWLSVVFTLRGAKIRVISVRPMSRKERIIYAEKDA